MIRLIVRQMDKRGISPAACLRKTQLTEKDIDDPTRMVSVSQECKVFSNVRHCTDDETWGLELGKLSHGHLTKQGIYGYTILSSPTLRDCIKFTLYGNKLTNTIYFYQLTVGMQTAELHLHPKYNFHECAQLRFDYEIASVHQTMRALLGRKLKLTSVSMMSNNRAILSEYQSFLGCPVKFGAPTNKIEFPASLLDIPLFNGDGETFELCSERCRRNVEIICGAKSATSVQIRELIEETRDFSMNMDTAAEALHVSGRTLRRRLQGEGNTFQGIVAHVRMNMAVDYLANSDYLVEEIAFKLGYSDQSTFTHAFKRWTGASPTDYRSRSNPRR